MQNLTAEVALEKSSKLLDLMAVASLDNVVCWAAYAVEAACVSGAVALTVALAAAWGSLFNGAAFGAVFILVFLFCGAVSAMAVAVAIGCHRPALASSVALAMQGAGVVVFFTILGDDLEEDELEGIRSKRSLNAWSLIPHVALDLGVNSFREQYDALMLPRVCGMLVADTLLFVVAAWYLAQVLPTTYGRPGRRATFIIDPRFWIPENYALVTSFICGLSGEKGPTEASPLFAESDAEQGASTDYLDENSFEQLGPAPAATCVIRGLSKTFGENVAVDALKLDLYENEVFALLGHNGSGKTTLVNVLAGLVSSDGTAEDSAFDWCDVLCATAYSADEAARRDGGARVYGMRIRDEMAEIRRLTGLCPQNDVLFGKLTAREHLELFASIKGASASARVEAAELLTHFDLKREADAVSAELSGGSRRKLAAALALCGQSKFVLLDEPTAGMDALARRDLWDFLGSAKRGRTILLTTQYMDEADVLGDRMGILARGKLKCCGSANFLKTTLGTGYRLVLQWLPLAGLADEERQRSFEAFVRARVGARARRLAEDSANPKTAGSTTVVLLPSEAVSRFSPFFDALDEKIERQADFGLVSYDLTMVSLAEVFTSVGGGNEEDREEGRSYKSVGDSKLEALRQASSTTSLKRQTYFIFRQRLQMALNDVGYTAALVLLPIFGVVAGFMLSTSEVFSGNDETNDYVAMAVAMLALFLYPALVAAQMVRDRETKLRSVLTVMGCHPLAYWLGCFAGDFALWVLVALGYYATVNVSGLARWYGEPVFYFFVLELGAQLIAFSYAMSNLFDVSGHCLALLPPLELFLLVGGNVLAFVSFLLVRPFRDGFSLEDASLANVWFTVFKSPQGAGFFGLIDLVAPLPESLQPRPTTISIALIIGVEGVFCVVFAYWRDMVWLNKLPRVWPSKVVSVHAGGDADVLREREAVATMMRTPALRRRAFAKADVQDLKAPEEACEYALVVERLRKIYRTKYSTGLSLADVALSYVMAPFSSPSECVAVYDSSFRVAKGSCFGLLGANGAGKSTTLMAIMRATKLTMGDVFIAGHSILDDFEAASKSLGAVMQYNALWDSLTCLEHLRLFAEVRGVADVERLVDAAIDLFQLRPHADKCAKALSGGLKRKLCVAIAVMGDPACVLLDEPSAGLDPLSRRNMWGVLRTTMASRSVLLASHLVDEVEALCDTVGMMVRGKLRKLGTVAHLRSHGGSGVYNVEVRTPPLNRVAVEDLVKSLYPANRDAVTVVEPRKGSYAGVVRCTVAAESMKVGAAFAALESHRAKLAIADYAIAKPSLETVFIDTMDQFGEEDVRNLDVDAFELGEFDGEFEPRLTGCTREQHRLIASAGILLTLVGMGLSLTVPRASIALVLTITILIWGTVGWCCVLSPRADPDDAPR
ncbi:P-loop containing nucleoside triphosphate hydrolase protein [Pelagophyceae sp. CCMP2097]|nr:P-loop containing nucleoside triphosphate hydrolase protein [Pelagophyceae sp. CCMP2097]